MKRENLTVEVGTARRRNGMVMNNSWSENSSRVEVEAEPVVVNRDYGRLNL